jgi:TorA maturation chaperone TorD
MTKLTEYFSDAVHDAEVFALLSAFYNTNPDLHMVESLSAIGIADIQDAEIKTELDIITTYASKAASDRSGDMITKLKVDWTKLFRGLSPDYGPKPPYEELYGGGPETIYRLASFYTANDYHDYTEIDNRPDYIGTQLDFLKTLALKKAQAADEEASTECERLDGVSARFAERVGRWFAKFAAEAEKHAETVFYKEAMRLSSRLL